MEQIQEIKTKIKSIKCPNECGGYLVLKKNSTEVIKGEKIWVCRNCVSFYPENWFDEFKQFEEEFVEREK